MSKQDKFNPATFKAYLRQLLTAHNYTMRQASLRCNLDPSAIGRFMHGVQPHRDSCMLLAQGLQADPNRMLVMAGYDPLPIMDWSMINPDEFAPDVKAFAAEIQLLAPERRRAIFEAVRTLCHAEFHPV